MTKSFWNTLPIPFTVLAPMEGVTDYVFRDIIQEIGRPNIFFTEFTNVDGLTSELGFEKVSENLKFSNHQKPIVAQIWGKNPESFRRSAEICRRMEFSGIDINMGCPDRIIINRGSCGALIKNPELAKEIIKQTIAGAGNLPVSIKTRLGFSEINLDWIKLLLSQNLPALTLHLRTIAELSKVPAHWDLMTEIIKLRNEISPHTLIIGNGDLLTMGEIKNKYEEYKCDGFMVGRGIFHNPWLFNREVDINKVTVNERVDLYLKHINLFELTWKEKNIALLKRFCKTYLNNFPDAVNLREKIMETKSISEMKNILSDFNQQP